MTASETVTGDVPPALGLDHAYDDVDEPTEITLYDADAADVTATWITAAVEDTVELGAMD